MKLQSFALVLFTFFSQQVFAWSSTGHVLVCSIVAQHLNPTATSAVSYLLGDEQHQINFPGSHGYSYYTNSLPSACTWMDNVNFAHWPSPTDQDHFKQVHFVDAVITQDETPSQENSQAAVSKVLADNPYNVVNAIQGSIKTLMTESESDAPLNRAFALRILIHAAGDLHQPLHASGPIILGKDTRGGNSISLAPLVHIKEITTDGETQHVGSATNFHAFWDDMADENHLNHQWNSFYKEISSPTPAFGMQILSDSATELTQQYMNDPDVARQKGDPHVINWAVNSNLLAVQEIKNLQFFPRAATPNDPAIASTTLDDDYIKQAQVVADKQLLLAGLHLAGLLNAIFTPNEADVNYVAYVNAVANDPHIKPIEQLLDIKIS